MQLQPPITTNISHTYANCPLFSFLESVGQYYCQMSHSETRRANHCCGSVLEFCWGPWNTPQRHQKAATTTNHNKHQPYLRQLPPFFIPGGFYEVCKWAIVWQGEPTIVVAVFQIIARVHGTHHKGTRRQLPPPITSNISQT